MTINNDTRKRLERVIDEWIESEQQDDSLDMYISSTLAERMALAAWAVLTESRATQTWLKKEGHMNVRTQ